VRHSREAAAAVTIGRHNRVGDHKMPLFFLPFLYSQILLSGATTAWSEPVDEKYSPSLPSPETIEQVLR
jgi:hypothetical protein